MHFQIMGEKINQRTICIRLYMNRKTNCQPWPLRGASRAASLEWGVAMVWGKMRQAAVKGGDMTASAWKSAAVCALLFLGACANKPAIPYDRPSAGTVKTIGLLTPDLPNEPSAVLASSVGQSFGLIGALIDAGMESGRDSSLTKILNAQQFVLDKAVTDGMTASLRAHGYEVVVIPVSRAEKGKFLKSYASTGGAKVDAYLDVVAAGYGYVAAGITSSTPYRPYFYTQCKLVRESDGSVLMEDTVHYNPVLAAGGNTDHVTIDPDPDYVFEKFSDIEANPGKAAKGVSVAVMQTTDAIGRLLR